jgi:hypothetical protein
MSDERTLHVVGTTGGKATVEVRRAPADAEVNSWFTSVRQPETARERVEAMVRLFHPDDYPELTVDDLRALPSTKCEFLDGNLYVGGRWYGHGAHARALLALLLNPPSEPERNGKRL